MSIQHLPKVLATAAMGGLLAVAASSAFAQQTADLSITGTIIPTPCTVNVDGNSAANFGAIQPASSQAGDDYRVVGDTGSAMSMVVQCPANRKVSFTVLDGLAGSAVTDAGLRDLLKTISPTAPDANQVFGLGTVTVNGKTINLGAYSLETLAAGSAQIGTATSAAIRSQDGTSGWERTNFYGADGATYATNRAPDMANGPVAAQTVRFPMRLRAAVNKPSELQQADEIKLQGEAVFTVKYE
ncbi:hypothetical protein PI87_17030 [Ralstonia sp. A12]|uniref:DUF1120 domain-containing protein n=1 Tax=Ralstonia sp. A12 TaxID=1217052 RepID=UPI00057560BB|nr:DUF1120 domain-containing protein [Ralstonia sp. A12]KHK53547.1 hypothetical protein PI87_17030 [Ralstonia sp. A12]